MTTISPTKSISEKTVWASAESPSLLELAPGKEAVVHHILDQRLAARLAALGLTHGVRLTMLRKRKKDPLLIMVRKTRIALARNIAEQILIQRGEAA